MTYSTHSGHRRRGFQLARTILAVAVPAVGLAVPALRQETPPSAAFSSLEKRPAHLVLSSAAARGEVTYDVLEQEIRITWFHRSPSGDPLLSIQTETVSFWPTEVASFGVDQILVAGKDTSNGQALVERWTFEPPVPQPAPYIDIATGQVIVPDVHMPVAERRLVHRSSAQGLVRTLLRRQGTSHGAFVQFHGSRHLYDLNTSNGVLTPVFAVAALPGHPEVTVLPELAEVTTHRWSATHEVWGHVYHLGRLSGDRGLYLFDIDKDGGIDEYGPLSIETFWERELDQGERYEALF